MQYHGLLMYPAFIVAILIASAYADKRFGKQNKTRSKKQRSCSGLGKFDKRIERSSVSCNS